MNIQQQLSLGFQQLNDGNLPAAAQLFESVLHQDPQSVAALNGRGFVALQRNQLPQSMADFQQSLAINPKQPFAHKMLGIVLGAMGQFEDSIQAFDAALTIDTSDPEIYFNRANLLFQAGKAQEALADLDAAVKLRDSYLEARSNRANLLIQLGDFVRAEKDLDFLVGKVVNNPDLLVARGLAKYKVGNYREAMECNERALNLFPNHPDALLNSSSAAYDEGEYPSALVWADKAIASTPNRAVAHYARAQALMALSRFEEAVSEFVISSKLDPKNVTYYLKTGACYLKQKKYIQAEGVYRYALELDPNNTKNYVLLGSCLELQSKFTEAATAYQYAINCDPLNAQAFNSLGVVLERLNYIEESLKFFIKAAEIDPLYSQAVLNSAILLCKLKRFEESKEAYIKASDLDPTLKWMLGDFLFLLAKLCDWPTHSQKLEQLFLMLNRSLKVSNPFPLLSAPSNLEQQRQCASIYSADKFSVGQNRNYFFKRPNSKKIRVAYLSSDYYGHATSYLMAKVFELHDRSRFEVIGVCYGRSPQDQMRERIAKSFDRFIEVSDKPDQDVAERLREMGIDIAVDLKGYTEGNRLGILAERVAPIQIHYLGYPGTLGAEFIDYLVADPTLIPDAHRMHYAEKIIYMPDTYQANDRSRYICSIKDKRSDHGLPDDGFVFCCFNNNWKVTSDIFDVWMRLLNNVDHSVLWLFGDNDQSIKNLKHEANFRGIDPSRLIFAGRMEQAKHLARQRHADLFLDTLYYNAHTTASDALWVGLPLITRLGNTYASRVAASLLKAVGMPELVVDTIEKYEELAMDLASNPARLSMIRKRLLDNRLTTPLFDTQLFTKNLEKAYENVWARYTADMAPDHIYI